MIDSDHEPERRAAFRLRQRPQTSMPTAAAQATVITTPNFGVHPRQAVEIAPPNALNLTADEDKYAVIGMEQMRDPAVRASYDNMLKIFDQTAIGELPFPCVLSGPLLA